MPQNFNAEQLSSLYQETGSLTGMAEALGVSLPTVRKYMKRFGIEYNSSPRRYPIFQKFFSESNDGEANHYWAGFLAANASIFHTAGNEHSPRGIEKAYRIYCNVAVEDRIQLEHLTQALQTNVPVRTEVVSLDGRPYTRAAVLISSKDLVMDLMRFEVLPDKKANFVMPGWLQASPWVRHFIRGWVDGLGGFYLSSGKKIFRTRGTVAFLRQLRSVLDRELHLNRLDRVENKDGQIDFIDPEDVLLIAHWLYSDAEWFLRRKRDLAYRDQITTSKLSKR